MLTKILRQFIAKKKGPFIFRAYDDNICFTSIPENIGLYIHIPFCQTLCHYCPYNKTIYDAEQAGKYQKALLLELSLLKEYLTHKQITSIYIGGGTPTLMLPQLGEIVAWIRKNLGFKGDLGIEIYPRDIDQDILTQLREMGINLISIGVQTFNDRLLQFLGRRYTGREARKAVELITESDFECVDVDIMFNLPDQDLDDIERDISICYKADIDQISIYPLIIFPLTPLHEEIKGQGLHTYNFLQEYSILKKIEKLSAQWDYVKTSIWTYGKRSTKRYTSVTRESFIGVGAGATSLFSNYFYLNTFNTGAYIRKLQQGQLPINLVNEMSARERMAFWLFWRCYETCIDTKRFEELFGKEFSREFPLLEKGLLVSGLAKKSGNSIKLTGFGAYLYHLLEKHYSLTYLNDMWAACMANPWLEEMVL